jgi:hypothetical protein
MLCSACSGRPPLELEPWCGPGDAAQRFRPLHGAKSELAALRRRILRTRARRRSVPGVGTAKFDAGFAASIALPAAILAVTHE